MKTITLDLTNCNYLGEIHERIKNAFNFPDWYGENRNAFWDLLNEPTDETIVILIGINSLPQELKKSGEMIIYLLEKNKKFYIDYMKKHPEHNYKFDYKVVS